MKAARRLHASAALASLFLGCQSRVPEPESRPAAPAAPATATVAATKAPETPAPVERTSSGGDPVHGEFTLVNATADLPGTGALSARIETDLGTLECELYSDKAPITVANFVGLARGLRPFKTPEGVWIKRPAYDGTIFHRVIKGFMIQGGDPSGTGAGEPGYVIPDEIWPGATHDRRGLLCMANRGPNTNGQQFFVTDAAAPHLDKGYTIFGKCEPDSVIEKLASVPVEGDHSTSPSKIKKVTIARAVK